MESNWSTKVEDLIDKGDEDGAISLLESVIANLETLNSSPSSSDLLRLAAALTDLSNLYSNRGFSLKSDDLQSRAFVIKERAQRIHCSQGVSGLDKNGGLLSSGASDSGVAGSCDCDDDDNDDWEAIADLTLNEETCSLKDDVLISKLSLGEPEIKTPKRRGRGSFLYSKSGLYSDQQHDVADRDDSDDEVACHTTERNSENEKTRFGTGHVLVLADFPPSTRTTDLEKLFESFKDRGVAIRWVNDTVALAVFRNPSVAADAYNSSHFPFMVRSLNEDDDLLSSISRRDLEPPYPRPKTSVRTAQRLIAQGMGHKIPKSPFGSNELRKQEEARRQRIITRQALRDEAWGAD
ncbi:hypothetical protein Scep_003437 [Stephania cephalantha]|uniref:Coiled-coil domain-containing protein R3HCC1L n=1 Tax=Stephania cephalantha TaxID=152367 RepID=A0AAP0PUF7_9MAGN